MFLYCRHVVNQLKQRRTLFYCLQTKWVPVRYGNFECLQCKRIKTRLTLDGVRLKQQGKFVDKNHEARSIRVLYFSHRRQHLNF